MAAIENYGRYRDVDGDGFLQNATRFGVGSHLYRGTGHDEDGIYSEDPEVYQKLMMRLKEEIIQCRNTFQGP